MSNLVSLRGEAILAPGEVNPEVVEIAEKLLDMARSGEINAIVAFTTHADDGISTFRRGTTSYRLIGTITAALHEMCVGKD